ncbi:MAG: TOBE domain-containing protein [Micrococcales bacterium]|nr:TOBE domain-containing protein [Micrococcales bacterium]
MPDTSFRVRDAAALLGVSDDTVRRLIEHGDLPAAKDDAGRIVLDGVALADYARERAARPPDVLTGATSARNQFVGLVTAVTCDAVMAEVELQCGPFTVVSLMSSRSVARLGLRPGSLAVAVVKATTVIIDTPATPSHPSGGNA